VKKTSDKALHSTLKNDSNDRVLITNTRPSFLYTTVYCIATKHILDYHT